MRVGLAGTSCIQLDFVQTQLSAATSDHVVAFNIDICKVINISPTGFPFRSSSALYCNRMRSDKKYGSRLCFLKAKFFTPVLFLFMFYPLNSPADEKYDWKSDWSLTENFEISIDTEGYRFPTAIAFVPNPGYGPKDPLYFVTELRGKVKVVTNDRTVYTFAEDFFKLKPGEELPAMSGESGLAGICLDPANGYVFVTFAYHDENNILRNNIIRFQSKPGTFSLTPTSQLAFTDIFSSEISSVSHQIGPCQVYDNTLYVNVGNAMIDSKSQDINSLLGKIIRMDLDGEPVRSNPFYTDDDTNKARNYVWAYGFRNPFGLNILNGRVFVADNGLAVDRFLEVGKNGNYLWDGSDESIATNADFVIVPGVGVTQMTYVPEDLNIFPEEHRGKFYLNRSGSPVDDLTKYKNIGGRSIISINYDFENNRLVSTPGTFLKYRGKTSQTLAGLAAGPDGLYFVPIMPFADGRSAVLKVTYDPENKHPYTLKNETDAQALLGRYGCYGCHMRNEVGWGSSGPRLDRDLLVKRVSDRLSSEKYIDSVKKLDELDIEPYKSYRNARHEVLNDRGEDRIKTWVRYHIMEPRFDNPNSQMPNLGIKENEAQLMTDYLVDEQIDLKKTGWKILVELIPRLKYRYLVYSFLLGIVFTLLIAGSYAYIRRKKPGRG
ncbi:MAG: PQQ-dependent sugar dehydrogenase [Thermodesulfobacteriota bacterium]